MVTLVLQSLRNIVSKSLQERILPQLFDIRFLCSLDLAPLDYNVFSQFKKCLKGLTFSFNEEMKLLRLGFQKKIPRSLNN